MNHCHLQNFCPAVPKKAAEIVGIGVSNAFSLRPVGSVAFHDKPHNLINVAPGFITDHIHALM